ncbi:dihydropteroate synthase [Parasphingorhabdus pacifica]
MTTTSEHVTSEPNPPPSAQPAGMATLLRKLRDPRPLLCGIVNATPDSFSEGGSYLDCEAAVEHGLLLAVDGADLLDVGGPVRHRQPSSVTAAVLATQRGAKIRRVHDVAATGDALTRLDAHTSAKAPR